MVRFMMGIWYSTLLVSEYAITISILLVIVFSLLFVRHEDYTLYAQFYVVNKSR